MSAIARPSAHPELQAHKFYLIFCTIGTFSTEFFRAILQTANLEESRDPYLPSRLQSAVHVQLFFAVSDLRQPI